INADSNELGSSNARSNSRLRMFRVIRFQAPRLDGFASLHTLSTNGADVNKPATHGRTSSVISAFGNLSRMAFIAGMASTASPTQFGPRIRIFLTSIRARQPACDQSHQAFEVGNLSRDLQIAVWPVRHA